MDFPLIVPLKLVFHVIIVVDVLPVIRQPHLFAQNASLVHSLAVQHVQYAINHAFNVVAAQQIAFLAHLENIQMEETAFHVLKTVLFVQMLQLVQNVQRDQSWSG